LSFIDSITLKNVQIKGSFDNNEAILNPIIKKVKIFHDLKVKQIYEKDKKIRVINSMHILNEIKEDKLF